MTTVLDPGAQTTVGNLPGDWGDTDIATLADGSYVIVWRNTSADASGGIYYQLYSPAGVAESPETRIPAAGAAVPKVAATSDGGFVVVWNVGNTTSRPVYGQLYDASGAAVGGQTLIANNVFSGIFAVSGLQNGGYVVAMTVIDATNSARNDIVAQTVNADGQLAQPQTKVGNHTTTNGTGNLGVAVLSDGSYVVTWDAPPSSMPDILARHFSSTGHALGDAFTVNAATDGRQAVPAIAALADGGYVIAWMGNGSGEAPGIFLQRFDAGDHAVGTEILVNTTLVGSHLYPDIAALSDGGFEVVWEATTTHGVSKFIEGQRFDDQGQRIGPEIQFNVSGTDAYLPSVGGLPDGGLAVSWQTGFVIPNDGMRLRLQTHAASTAGSQLLFGTSHGDLLDGGAGADSMYGGHGDDTYVVSNAGDVVSEESLPGSDDGGADTVQSSVGYTLGNFIEKLTLTGTGDTHGVGNGLDNALRGNAGGNVLKGLGGDDTLLGFDGDDRLDGGTGADQMWGGHGDDTYVVDSASDLVTEYTNGGNDTVWSSIDYTLGWQVENLGLTGTDNLNGSGNKLNNVLRGNDGDNVLKGFAGDDTLTGHDGNDLLDGGTGADHMGGGHGDDTYVVDNVGDTVVEYGGHGTDTILSSISLTLGWQVENLVLTGTTNLQADGNELNNSLIGNAGNNRLNGEGGNDTLTGGDGADRFIFGAHSGLDVIEDFSASQGDRIDLQAVTGGHVTTSMLTLVGTDTHIDLGGGNVVVVIGTTPGDLLGHILW